MLDFGCYYHSFCLGARLHCALAIHAAAGRQHETYRPAIEVLQDSGIASHALHMPCICLACLSGAFRAVCAAGSKGPGVGLAVAAPGRRRVRTKPRAERVGSCHARTVTGGAEAFGALRCEVCPAKMLVRSGQRGRGTCTARCMPGSGRDTRP